jgi:hypothetical protein
MVGEIIAAISLFELDNCDDDDTVDACDVGPSNVSLINAKSFPVKTGTNTSLSLISLDDFNFDFAGLFSGKGVATGENGT